MLSVFHRITHTGMMTATQVQSPCRNVRRISRTECGRAPFSDAIIGAVAVISPMLKIAKIIARLCPIAPAASSLGPSQPKRMTSVTPISIIDRFDNIIGQASVAVARSSSRQGDWRSIGIAAVVMGGGG